MEFGICYISGVLFNPFLIYIRTTPNGNEFFELCSSVFTFEYQMFTDYSQNEIFYSLKFVKNNIRVSAK